MFLAEGLKRSIWIAPAGDMENGVRKFGTPVEYEWNWRVLGSSAELMAFGPEYLDYRKAVTDNSEIANVNALDMVWMDVTPSDLTDVLASDADFYVVSADPGPGGFANVMFKRLSNDG